MVSREITLKLVSVLQIAGRSPAAQFDENVNVRKGDEMAVISSILPVDGGATG